MYKQNKINTSIMKAKNAVPGETMIEKMRRVLENKEPIKSDPRTMIFTERKAGVLPHTDIRTNRWDLAVDGTQLMSDQIRGKRDKETWEAEAKANMELEQKAQKEQTGGAKTNTGNEETK